MTVQRFLTGITTSGEPHLGNYVGANRPAIAASLAPNVESFYFLADYHALIKIDDPARIQRSTLEIAASFLACGLDPQRVRFYRQSDVPDIDELSWLLTCVTCKGLLNRAHAYKAAVDKNHAAGMDPDADVNAGLFMYPVLMTADILMFNAHKVPVGRDQVQHVEMARDIAQRFNSQFGMGRDFFVLPEAVISEDVAVLPGLDGRKMSKSYNNTIPLFDGGARALKSAVARVVTDSRGPGEPKDPDASHLYLIYRAFARPEQAALFRSELIAGLGWGDAKRMLCDLVEAELEPMRDHYEDLMAHPARIEEILQAGAHKARGIATPFIRELRDAVGLRALVGGSPSASGKAKAGKSEREARFVSFRDENGRFRFRLLSPAGEEILCSIAYADPKEAGKVMGRLKATQGAVDGLVQLRGDSGFVVSLDGQPVAHGAESDSADGRDRLVAAFHAALH